MKHLKKKEKKVWKKVLIYIIMIVLLVGWVRFEYLREQENIGHKQEEYNTTKLAQNTQVNESNSVTIISNLPKQYRGYPVIAKLEIPAISLETYVLSKYSENALKVSVAKFWGADPNQVGNFCIVGHNYLASNMFSNLKKLKQGDSIVIKDHKNQEIWYEIYAISKVTPKDTNCLSQETNGKREVTLITCTLDSKLRIVIKAREK